MIRFRKFLPALVISLSSGGAAYFFLSLELVLPVTGLAFCLLTILLKLVSAFGKKEKLREEIYNDMMKFIAKEAQTQTEKEKPTPAVKTNRKTEGKTLAVAGDDDNILLSIQNQTGTPDSHSPPKNPNARKPKKKEVAGTEQGFKNPYSTSPKKGGRREAEENPSKIEVPKKAKPEFNRTLEVVSNTVKDIDPLIAPPSATEFLGADDLKVSDEEISSQALATYKKAMNFLKTKAWKEAYDTIMSWVFFNEDVRLDLEEVAALIYLKGTTELYLGEMGIAEKTFAGYFNYFVNKPHYINITTDKLDELDRLAKELKHQDFRISFRHMALDLCRREKNYGRMDRIYGELEEIYFAKGDRKNLLEAYKNHYSIKKKLKTIEGQLDILDLMGKLYFDLGDKTSSRACYTESLKIKKEMPTNE